MSNLDECLTLTRELRELDEQIKEVKARAVYPRNQVMTGMPKGESSGNDVDNYMIKLERLESKRDRKASDRESVWGKCIETFKALNIAEEYIHLMWLRFFKGLQWKQCCAEMEREYPEGNYNINKVFRVYRKVIRKTR